MGSTLRRDSLLSYLAAVLVLLWAAPIVLLGVSPAWGVDYNPEFDAMALPFGLLFVYAALSILKFTHPRMPWISQPSVGQGCVFSWVGGLALFTVVGLIAAMVGRRSLDAANILWVWLFAVGLPFGLAALIQWLRPRGGDDDRAYH